MTLSSLLSLPLAMRLGPLDFAEPIWLLLLFTLIPIVYLWKNSRVPASPFRRYVSLALRSFLLLALVLSLAGTRIVWTTKGICVVFVLDQSQSVPGAIRDAIRDRISLEIEKMDKDDLFVIVEFGGDAVLGSLPSRKGKMPEPVKVIDSGHTDIARALRLAMATLPSDHQKRIVLFSDGNQNAGDALRESRIAANNDIDIDVLLVSARGGLEVMVDQLIVPNHVQKDANFVVRAIISSDTAQPAELLITRDDVPLQPVQVQLKAGTNVLDIPQALSDGGFHKYSVTVVPKGKEADTFAANNNGYAFTQVDAPGKVLHVRGRPQERNYLSDALAQPPARINVVTVSLGGLPSSVTGLAPYDTVIIDNVPAGPAGMSQAQMIAIRDWVKNHGGGLVLIGGDQAYGPGLWKGTPIEEVSPVEMDVKRQKHLASLAIVVVLDKSGSMGAPAAGGKLEKMDLANAGAVEVIKLLDPQDLAMVGAVDTEVKWMVDSRVIPMSQTNRNKLISNTRANQTGGGGIYCKTALTHAYELLTAPGVDTQTKHVILFADASDSDQQEGCRELAKQMFDKYKITTTVIGMGTKGDPHVNFQQDVAKAGKGRFDITDDVMNLPRIFAKETFIVSRNAFVEDPKGIPPTLYQSPLLEGFLRTDGGGSGGGVPKIFGYVGTTIKQRATLAIHGKEADDPVLAHWSIGLGKAVAYTPDSTARWGKDWVTWNGNPKFWAQVMRWVGKTTTNTSMAATTAIDGKNGRITVEAVDEKGKPRNNLQLKANITSPDINTELPAIPLEQVGPGTYAANFPASATGTYLVTVQDPATGEKTTGGGVLSYAPEYRELNPNAKLLKDLADASGGRYLSGVEGVFGPKSDPVKTFWPLWQILMIIAAAALFVDIAWRRLNLADWFKSALPTPARVPSLGDAVGAFRTVKSTKRQAAEQRDSLRDRIETRAASNLQTEESTTATATLESAQSDSATYTTPVKPAVSENYANRLMHAKKRAAQQIQDTKSDQPPK